MILAAFVLLLVTFRSIVVPIKAIVLNLLSVAASYGVLVLVFQHGWFKSLLGFSETGPITAWLPMFLFVVLFGLSMDYHVFILSRVREAVDRGMKTDAAVSHAIKNTAGVVTSAAFVMVGVFAIFGSLSFVMFKQMGVGLAFAVLLDATLIRGGPAAREHEAPGRGQLVAAQAAALAAEDRRRGRGGSGHGLGPGTTPAQCPGARPHGGRRSLWRAPAHQAPTPSTTASIVSAPRARATETRWWPSRTA